MTDLVSRLRAYASDYTTTTFHEDLVNEAADEIVRLSKCLEVANANHERFEREWYLRGDEIERLRADAKRYRWLRDVGDEHWTALIVRASKRADQIDSAIDAAMGNK